jgi:hypothetical protein
MTSLVFIDAARCNLQSKPTLAWTIGNGRSVEHTSRKLIDHIDPSAAAIDQASCVWSNDPRRMWLMAQHGRPTQPPPFFSFAFSFLPFLLIVCLDGLQN